MSLSCQASAAMVTTTVAIVIFGEATWQGKAVLKMFKENSLPIDMFDPVDVRNWMVKDPKHDRRYKVSHTENSEYVKTMQSLLNNTSYHTACREALHYITGTYEDECRKEGVEAHSDESNRMSKVMAFHCTAGIHRVDGIIKAAQKRILNAAYLDESDEQRQWNVNVFSMDGADNVSKVLKEADRWLRKPWDLVPADPYFGREACCSSAKARYVWEAVGNLKLFFSLRDIDTNPELYHATDHRNGELLEPEEPFDSDDEKSKAPKVEISAKRKPAPPAVAPPKAAARDKSKTRPWEKSYERKADSYRRPQSPTPPRKVPRTSQSSSSKVLDKKPESPPKAATTATDNDDWWQETTWYSKCPCCDGSGYISDWLPEYASFEITPAVLYSILKTHEIDDRAQSIVFQACQKHGELGVQRCWSILSNALKNWKFIGNPSAFISSAVTKFRKSVEPRYDEQESWE